MILGLKVVILNNFCEIRSEKEECRLLICGAV
jgi:hypothetical protein